MKIRLTSNHPGYYPQLDSLRAIAIMLVILFHWFPELAVVETLSTGPLGVTLFFVLSGFLITLILLNARRYVPQAGFVEIYRNFMVRRMLRIFPIYYFVLFFVWAAQFLPSLPKITTLFYENPVYYLAYGSNFLIAKHSDWTDMLSIYWTLAVEEQFYLFWPFVILLIPSKYLKTAILVCICFGIFSRVALILGGDYSGVLMPTCMDSFGLGGLWAYMLFNGEDVTDFVRKAGKVALVSLIIYLSLCFVDNDTVIKTLLFRTAMSLICLYFVLTATYDGGFKSRIGLILDNSSIRYLGKISYGMYIYHMLVPQFMMPVIVKVLNRLFNTEIVLAPGPFRIISLFLLCITSIISWYTLELPFRILKSQLRVTSRRVRE